MKKISKNSKITITTGVLFVLGLLILMYLYNPAPHITTPEKDAKFLAEQAETIHSELDLRQLEKLAYEYEIAYRNNYGGAKAMYFKSLVEPILIEAGDRRDAIREEEDYLRDQQNLFFSKLEDMDVAWRMKLGSDEDIFDMLNANDLRVLELTDEIAQLQADRVLLAEKAWQGDGATIDEKSLENLGKVDEKIKRLNHSIESINHDSEVIRLAYRLQRGMDFEYVRPMGEFPMEDETPAEELPVE